MKNLTKKLQTFFYSFKRSLVDITYYRHVLRASLPFSVKYFVVFIYFLIFFQSLFFAGATLLLVPKAPEFVKQVKARVKAAYPTELKLQIQKGTLSTNVQNPYYIDIPELQEVDDTEKYKHSITIDTKASEKSYRKYQTFLLVTEKGIVYPESEGNNTSTKFVSFKDMKPFYLDKAKYNSFMDKYLPYLDYLPVAMIVLAILGIIIIPFVITPFVVVGKMLYLILLAFIMWLVSLIFRNGISYRKVYQLGLHALTLPILLTSLLNLFAVRISFLYLATFGLWMVIILSKIKEDSKKI